MKSLFLLFLLMLAAAVVVVVIRVRRARDSAPTVGEILSASKMQEKYGLYAENREEIKIAPENVPEHLRDLVPMAEKWGIGDDIIRSDLEEKASENERAEFADTLRGRTADITGWLDSLGTKTPMPEEAVPFMYMLEALDESGLWPD